MDETGKIGHMYAFGIPGDWTYAYTYAWSFEDAKRSISKIMPDLKWNSCIRLSPHGSIEKMWMNE